jgi:hypothetical protein
MHCKEALIELTGNVPHAMLCISKQSKMSTVNISVDGANIAQLYENEVKELIRILERFV